MSDYQTMSALRTLDLHKLAQSSMKNMRSLDMTPVKGMSMLQSSNNRSGRKYLFFHLQLKVDHSLKTNKNQA